MESITALLSETAEELDHVLGMMEPYYSQAGGQESGTALLERVNKHPRVVAYREAQLKKHFEAVQKERGKTFCFKCHRQFKDEKAKSQHDKGKHGA